MANSCHGEDHWISNLGASWSSTGFSSWSTSVKLAGYNLLQILRSPGGARTEDYVNSIAHRRSRCHYCARGEFQHRRRLEPDWRHTPGPQLVLNVDYSVRAIEVYHVDGEPHA